jgi:DNA-binding MarR family transcriptional regulator
VKKKELKSIYDGLIDLKLEITKHFSKGFRKLGREHISYQKKNLNRTLFILYKKGDMTPTALGRLMDVRKSTMTAIVDLLTENEFVVIGNAEGDRRKKMIHLTEKGIEHAKLREGIVMELISESFKQLNPESVKELIDHLNGINTILMSIKD